MSNNHVYLVTDMVRKGINFDNYVIKLINNMQKPNRSRIFDRSHIETARGAADRSVSHSYSSNSSVSVSHAAESEASMMKQIAEKYMEVQQEAGRDRRKRSINFIASLFCPTVNLRTVIV